VLGQNQVIDYWSIAASGSLQKMLVLDSPSIFLYCNGHLWRDVEVFKYNFILPFT
jgi:hypothetical protein